MRYEWTMSSETLCDKAHNTTQHITEHELSVNIDIYSGQPSIGG